MPVWFRPTRMGQCFGATTLNAGERGIASRPFEDGEHTRFKETLNAARLNYPLCRPLSRQLQGGRFSLSPWIEHGLQ